jgi:hypothetical protein
MLFTICLMFKTMVVESGLFGAEVWGTAFLLQHHSINNPVEVAQRIVLRRLMRMRQSCPTWPLLSEFGVLPLQVQILSRCLGFWASVSCLHDESVYKKVLTQNVHDAHAMAGNSQRSNWSKQLARGLSLMPGCIERVVGRARQSACCHREG